MDLKETEPPGVLKFAPAKYSPQFYSISSMLIVSEISKSYIYICTLLDYGIWNTLAKIGMQITIF